MNDGMQQNLVKHEFRTDGLEYGNEYTAEYTRIVVYLINKCKKTKKIHRSRQ